MRIADSMVEKLLLKSRTCTKKRIAELRALEASQRKPLQDLVVAEGLISESELTKLYAKEINVPFKELNARELDFDVVKRVPEQVARQYNVIVFGFEDQAPLVAMQNPEDTQALQYLQKLFGSPVKAHASSDQHIQTVLDEYRLNTQSRQIISSDEELPQESENEASDSSADSAVAETVIQIIENGIKKEANTIHVEPRENLIVVRYRIDGLLVEVNKLPQKLMPLLVAQIKRLNGMDPHLNRAPQEGTSKLEVGEQTFTLRVSTMPVIHGEKITIHIMNNSHQPPSFRTLGLWGTALSNVQHAVVQSRGLVLVTGPIGSGKSTTLFSTLSVLNTSSANIATIEDGIKYRMNGVNQTQIDPANGITFASGLQALLHQDPNILMVGEVRDYTTAELMTQASLSGHLVFGSLHAPTTTSCLARLADMGLEPFLVASCVRVIVAQRLVRKLCVHCREHVAPGQETLKHITHSFQLHENGGIKRIHELEAEAFTEGLGKIAAHQNPEMSTTPDEIHKVWKAHKDGCPNCNHTGYKGRIGLFEVLTMSEALQGLIVSEKSGSTIKRTAVQEGMLPIQIDGLVKALHGLTTIDEILRVTSS